MEHRDTSAKGINVVLAGTPLAGQHCTLEWLSKHGGSTLSYRKLAGYECPSVQLQPSALLEESLELPVTYWWGSTSSIYHPGKYRAVFRRGDAHVFVVDTQKERMEANLDSLEKFLDVLAIRPAELGRRVGVVQYTKRDTPTALPLSEISEILNPMGWPEFETHPAQGLGMRKVVTKLLRMLHRNDVRRSDDGHSAV